MTAWKTLAIPDWLDKVLEDIKKAKKKRNKWEIIRDALKEYLKDDEGKALRFVDDIERVFELYGMPLPSNGRAFFRKLYFYLKDPSIDHEAKNFKFAILVDVLKGDYRLLKAELSEEDIKAEMESLKELGIIEEEPQTYEVIDENNEEELLEKEHEELLKELRQKAEQGDEEAKRLLAIFESLKDQAQD